MTMVIPIKWGVPGCCSCPQCLPSRHCSLRPHALAATFSVIAILTDNVAPPHPHIPRALNSELHVIRWRVGNNISAGYQIQPSRSIPQHLLPILLKPNNASPRPPTHHSAPTSTTSTAPSSRTRIGLLRVAHPDSATLVTCQPRDFSANGTASPPNAVLEVQTMEIGRNT